MSCCVLLCPVVCCCVRLCAVVSSCVLLCLLVSTLCPRFAHAQWQTISKLCSNRLQELIKILSEYKHKPQKNKLLEAKGDMGKNWLDDVSAEDDIYAEDDDFGDPEETAEMTAKKGIETDVPGGF